MPAGADGDAGFGENFTQRGSDLGQSVKYPVADIKNPIFRMASHQRPVAAICQIGYIRKIAAEIGSLGDNIAFLRHQIANDPARRAAAGRIVFINRQEDNATIGTGLTGRDFNGGQALFGT